MTKCGWVPRDSIDEVLEFISFQGAFAVPPEQASLLSNLPDANYQLFEANDYFVWTRTRAGTPRCSTNSHCPQTIRGCCSTQK